MLAGVQGAPYRGTALTCQQTTKVSSPGKWGSGELSLLKAAKTKAKKKGPVPCASALAPYSAPCTVPFREHSSLSEEV